MIVILHNIRSLYNVGSVFRTSDALGAEKIYLCGITPEPVDIFGKPRPQLIKVSLGAEKTVPYEKFFSASRLIGKLRKEGYKIFAVEQARNSIPYYKLPKSYVSDNKFCLIVGSEVDGLPLPILKKSDKILEIPMKGEVVRNIRHPKNAGRGKESLNVSVSFGIVAFGLTYR
jgi:tRNA G18 (ribose-2'-O)-methylase SpoU